MKLSKRNLKKVYKNRPELNKIKFWYLFWRGKTYLKKDTFYTKLWLINIDTANYPITKFGHFKIAIEILTVNIHKYIQGSIYNASGDCISIPLHDTKGLDNIEVSVNPEQGYLTKGLYQHLSNGGYPIPDYKFEVLKSAPFYLEKVNFNGMEISIILPIQVIIDFFFFSYSTKLNNYILDNIITDLFEVKGEVIKDGDRYGYLVQNGNQISEKLMLMFARYYFTETNSGIEAINELRSKHLINLKNGYEETYLYSSIPFSFNCTFKFIGQYIAEQKDIFLVHRITGFKPTDGQNPFDVKELIVSVINDTRSSENQQKQEEKNYDKVYNEYTGISGNETDHTDSDGSGNLIEIDVEEQPMYSFNEIPDKRKIPKGSDKDRYVLNKSINGDKFSGGTTNLRGLGDDKNVVKIDEITASVLLPWNVYAIGAIEKFCIEKKCSGNFIKLEYETENIKLEDYKEGYKNVFTSFRTKKMKRTKFILFEFFMDQGFYYFFEQGSGSYSALFRARNRMQFSKNELRLIFLSLAKNKILLWSKKRKDDNFLIKNNLHILQPIEHAGKSEIPEENTEEYRIEKLVNSLKKRINSDD